MFLFLQPEQYIISFILLSGKQLSRKARKETSSIAKVRIHVERAIEGLKEFKIFQGNIPLTSVKIMDQEIIVCASLCNLLPPLAR